MGDLVLNGVHYSTAGNLYYPVIYSDTERKIGVWRDNKPLYQKTIDISPLPNNTTKEIQLDADIERVISMRGYGIDSNDKWDVFFNDVVPTNVTGSIRVFANTVTKKLYINTGENLTSYTEAYVTIQYTKTTDTAGSGNWNTDGIPTHHYSTNEQVIGTWIDGKTLYECTVDGLSLSVNTSWTAEVATNLNIKFLVNATLYDNSNPTNPIVVNVEQVQVLNGGFRILHDNNSGRTITRAVIQYTKTTD